MALYNVTLKTSATFISPSGRKYIKDRTVVISDQTPEVDYCKNNSSFLVSKLQEKEPDPIPEKKNIVPKEEEKEPTPSVDTESPTPKIKRKKVKRKMTND